MTQWMIYGVFFALGFLAGIWFYTYLDVKGRL